MFLALNIFSATGGIEKVCRFAGKAIENYCRDNNFCELSFKSLHDATGSGKNNKYFDADALTSYNGNRAKFILDTLKKAPKTDVMILSHINLLVVGWMAKKINPKMKLVLFAHGIEIWDINSASKRKMLASCDKVLAVSQYTKDTIVQKGYIAEAKCTVLNNCLDPNLPDPASIVPSGEFAAKYGIEPGDFVILTLSRLSSIERYKGYEKVLIVLEDLKNHNFKYIIAGKADDKENAFLQGLIAKEQLQDKVSLPGYIPDEDIPYLFKLADLYAMPSTKEGFGLVFTEAMYFGLPVLAGNADGSVDALMNGRLGTLVNPNSTEDIKNKLQQIINNPTRNVPDFDLLISEFGFPAYEKKIANILNSLN